MVRMKIGMRFTMFVAKFITLLVCFIIMVKCDGLHTEEPVCQGFTADEIIKNLINLRRHNTSPCPCDVQKIQLDYTFRKSNTCYEQWFFVDGVKKLCCYNDNGRLLVGPPNGGYILLEEHEPYISAAHHQCCKSNSRLCQEFYATNPSTNCSKYEPPVSVKSGGDVHITTVDGVSYDFNGHGEYVFLKTKEFEIQARTQYVIQDKFDSTMFTAFVLWDRKNFEQIELHLNRSTNVTSVYRNGTDICNTVRNQMENCDKTLQKCFVLAGNGVVVIQGCSFGNYFSQIKISSGVFMDISFVELPKQRDNYKLSNFSGLAGNSSYGFVFRNGTLQPNNSAEPEIFKFGETWSLMNVEESYFNYSITSKSYSFYNGNHTQPRFLETLLLLRNFSELFKGYSKDNISIFTKTCTTSWDNKANDRCLLTIARTGDLSLAKAIIADIEEEHHHYTILHNKPPEFLSTMPDRITVQNGETYTLNLTKHVKDEETRGLRYFLTTNISNAEFELADDGYFTWRVGHALRSMNTSLVFTVFDSLNGSNSHEVKLSYCGCEDLLHCDWNTTAKSSTDQVKRASCKCQKYHSGEYCEIFTDPCANKTLKCYSSCDSSTPQNFTSWPCTPCPRGTEDHMTGDTQECRDINECETKVDGCKQFCHNTNGSYYCTCSPGYNINSDNRSCDDIDECTSSPCPANKICTNTKGNYTCDCEPGFVFEHNDCVKIQGYRFVGEIEFAINPITTISDILDNQSKKNLTNKLLQAFNDTAGFITVQIYSLSINASTGTHQPSLLRAKIIVHWANNSSATIQSSLQSSLGRKLVIPFNLQSLEIQSIQNFTIFTPNVFGLCDVPGETDCDLSTTDCVNKIDLKGFECRCKSGYMPPKRSNINTPYCIDIIECEWENIAELCLNGNCSNTIGSWSCQCPNRRYPTSKDLSTNTTRKFRCVGNFIYTGRMELFWLNPNVNKTQVEKLFQDKISDLFRTSNTTVDKYPISDIFLNLEILGINMSPIIGIGSRINVTYSLHTGEQTTPNKLQNIQNILFETIKTFKEGEDIITIQTYLIYEESEHNLCDDTEKTKCDKETTVCNVDKGLYTCRCKRGYTNTSDPYTCQDIDECDLTGVHKCTNEGTCRNLPGKWTCDCPTGFEPIYNDDKNVTCEDIDECRQNESYICKGGCCKNVIGGWNCTCPSGYNRDELKRGYIYTCTDIDECDDHSLSFCSNGGYCKNNPGNWTCDCQNGYEAHAYNNTFIECKDINECEIKEKFSCDGPDNSSSCLNTNGSWDCQCASGYRKRNYSLNNRTCEDIDECVAGECIGGKCENTDGGFLCLCQTGFTNTSSEGHQHCTDIDECTSGQSKCHGGGTCSNTPGNWTCSCQTGFTPTFYNEKNITCEDFDECLHNGTYICNGGHCSNTIGGWNCSCSAGYYSKEIIKNSVYTCTDVDECSGAAVCMNGGTCVNLPGKWTCECSEGFRANSINNTLIDCKDINECLENETYICTGGTCVDLNGSWNCTCPAGYKLTELQRDRVYTCSDIDECRSGTYCSNGGTCINNPGNWTCSCKDGFEAKYINNTYIDCKDIDECSQNDKACIDGDCKNTVGAWQCLCVEGKKENVINETTKACSGVYVYAVTLEFAAVTTEKDNIDENNPKLIKYFEEQILQAYHTSFPQSTVKVNILKIKRSERQKRATEMSKWNVDFVAEFDKQLEQNDVVSALTNHTETCRLNNCQVNSEFPFTMLNAKLEPDPAPVVCDHYRYCDEETTRCEYVNHTTKCTCKIGYEPKDNTDTTCRVKPDVCKKEAVCEHDATCVQPDNSGSFKCICQKGWTGETCNIAQTSVNDSDQTNTMMIAVGGSLGGIVIILLVTIFVVCRWRGKKVKEAEKIALKNMDNNGSKHFDGSLYDDRYIGDSQNNSLERKSVNSFRVPRQNESPIQSGYRLSAANLYATPHKLHRQTIHGSMIDLTNGHADHLRDEPRRLSIQDPQRHIASNMGWSYTANTTRPVSLNGDILRKHPQADYNRPPSPQPDYHRNERLDAARDSGVGVGHNRHGSFSNDYRHSDPLRRIPFDGPNGETRF